MTANDSLQPTVIACRRLNSDVSTAGGLSLGVSKHDIG